MHFYIDEAKRNTYNSPQDDTNFVDIICIFLMNPHTQDLKAGNPHAGFFFIPPVFAHHCLLRDKNLGKIQSHNSLDQKHQDDTRKPSPLSTAYKKPARKKDSADDKKPESITG